MVLPLLGDSRTLLKAFEMATIKIRFKTVEILNF